MAKHTPERDNSFVVSLMRHGAAAVALVLVVAAAFWGIGQVGGDDTELLVAEPTDQATTASEPASPTSAASATEAAPATTEPAATPTPTSKPSPEAAPSPTETETETPTEEPAEEVEPSTVSVQVLDAVLDDGGAKANEIADDLRAAGYNVVVVNQASKVYETTTVFWSPGGEAGAKQIGSQFGFSKVEQKPDNLSDSVDVHLVVGQDA